MSTPRPRFAAVLALAGFAAALAAAVPAPAPAQSRPQPRTVAITAIVEHPALDALRAGVVEALTEAGWTPGADLRIEFHDAQGNPATAAQIARQFAGSRPDVIVPISTPSAQAVAAATRDIPVVFAAVTDPVGAHLLNAMEAPGGNITGVSDLAPVAEHIALIREVLPDARRIGVLYNPGEPNSVSLVALLKQFAAEQGLSVVEATVARPAEARQAARSLVGRADALYVPLDNTVVSALEAVTAVGRQAKLPVFSADTDSVARGTVASVGFDYFEVGRQTGALVARVLRGETPSEIPAIYAEGTDLHVNPAAAEAMGVTLPGSVVSVAAKVIGR